MNGRDCTVRLFFKDGSGEVKVISSGNGALALIGTAAAGAVAVSFAPAIMAKAEKLGIGERFAAKLLKAYNFFTGSSAAKAN